MRVYVPQPIPYQGSKRHIAKFILAFVPGTVEILLEPFAGSAAVSLAAAAFGKARYFHLNDINKPLMMLWREIIDNPESLADNYERLWFQQLGQERTFYDSIRIEFNKTARPDYFLYLLARCVKASIRYNARGEFNQSPDNRRLGRNPAEMRRDILVASGLLRGRTTLTSNDFREVLEWVPQNALVYMDPPYQGVCTGRDPRYYCGVNYDELVTALRDLNRKRIAFMVSYDGRRGNKAYGRRLPDELRLCRLELKVGRSAQATLLGRDEITYEALYLSPTLLDQLGLSPSQAQEIANNLTKGGWQLTLKGEEKVASLR